MRTCVVCGVSIEHRSKNAATCSKTCLKAMQSERRRRPLGLRRCVCCGNEFKIRSPLATLCSSDCKRKRRSEQDKIKRSQSEPRKIAECVVCGDSLRLRHKNATVCSVECKRNRMRSYMKIWRCENADHVRECKRGEYWRNRDKHLQSRAVLRAGEREKRCLAEKKRQREMDEAVATLVALGLLDAPAKSKSATRLAARDVIRQMKL